MVEHKEVHRVFYMVKGYITSDKIAYASYDGYFKRLWYDEESYLKEDGFEEAYGRAFMMGAKQDRLMLESSK
ncbi:MAG: hypothetical protein VXW06_06715 [Pseudomonadota bacterium]|nr:hypothetical protein [Pseudomonadota bacterium]